MYGAVEVRHRIFFSSVLGTSKYEASGLGRWLQPKAVYRGQLKCYDTRAETTFRLSAKRTSPFKSAVGRQFSRLLAAEVCASAVVMLDTPCSEVVWRVLATHCIRQFPIQFPSRASPCAITFQLQSNSGGWTARFHGQILCFVDVHLDTSLL